MKANNGSSNLHHLSEEKFNKNITGSQWSILLFADCTCNVAKPFTNPGVRSYRSREPRYRFDISLLGGAMGLVILLFLTILTIFYFKSSLPVKFFLWEDLVCVLMRIIPEIKTKFTFYSK